MEDEERPQDEDSPRLMGHCEICKGPIYFGEMISYRTENDVFYMSHRFSTWCAHYEEQRSKFLKDCGIAVEGEEQHGDRNPNDVEYAGSY